MSISVVIPVYNGAKFLGETIKSALTQSLPPDEIIVVDDGSTDDSASVAESFGVPVKVFRRANARQAAARNFGCEQATGEWVALLDSDDLWEPNKLELQLQQLNAHPQADLCYTARVYYENNGDGWRCGKVVNVPPDSEIREALKFDPTFLPSSVMIRRSTLLRNGGFDSSSKWGNEDYECWLRLSNSGVVFTGLQEPLVLYRRHGGNTRLHLPWLEEALEVHQRHVMPHLHGTEARRIRNHYCAELEANCAYYLRDSKQPGYIRMMARALLHRPFYQPMRYKVMAHMIFYRFFQRRTAGA